MKRIQILKLNFQYQHSKKLLNRTNSPCLNMVHRFSNRCQIAQQKYTSPQHQSSSKENIISDGIVRSAFPDIEEINADFTLEKFVWEHMNRWPNHIAVECGVTGQKYTFSKLRILCKKFAASLQKQGYQPGQVLSIMLPNTPDYVIALMGAIEAGMIVSPINPVYTPYELSHQLHDNGAVVILTQPDFIAKLNQAKKLIKTNHNIDYKIDTIVINYNTTFSNSQDVITFKDMISDHVDHTQLKRVNRTIDNVAILPYSSGTTGLSKGVKLTHKNCVCNLFQIDTADTIHFYPTTNDHQDVLPAVLPYFHIYGLAITLLRGLRMGVKMVTLPKFEIAPFFTILKDHRATILYAVPPIILLLGNHPLLTDEHVASLRLILTGAAPIGATDAEKVVNRFTSNFVINQAYGLTETSPVVLVGSQNEQDYVSVGKPIRSTFVKVIKSDGTIALPEELGEILVKGPQVMLGYLNKPDATREVIDDEKYFHTGDVGYYDENGKFYIVDRFKELIKVKGFQVPPAELETLLRSHAKVIDAAVIGIPDAKTGEKPLAFVVAKSHENTVQKHELMQFVSSKVAPYKQLGDVVFVDCIPKNPSGKILRRQLREKFFSTN